MTSKKKITRVSGEKTHPPLPEPKIKKPWIAKPTPTLPWDIVEYGANQLRDWVNNLSTGTTPKSGTESAAISDFIDATVSRGKTGTAVDEDVTPKRGPEAIVDLWPGFEPDEDTTRRPVGIYPSRFEQTTSDLLALRSEIVANVHPTPPPEKPPEDKPKPPQDCAEIEEALRSRGISFDLCGRNQRELDIVGTIKGALSSKNGSSRKISSLQRFINGSKKKT